MQNGLLLEYTYSGDEAPWRAAIETFISHIRSDPKLAGKVTYTVFRRKDDPTRRVHMPRWDSAETLAHLQSQPWFKEFTEHVRRYAGDTLKTSPIMVELTSV